MALIKATKGAKRAVFSQGAWASGQPQRYGWHSEEDQPLKKLPAEILEFATIRKKLKPELDEPIVPAVEEVKAEVKPKPKPKAKAKAKVEPKAEVKSAPKPKKGTKA